MTSKSVLITGAGIGIGKATAMASEGPAIGSLSPIFWKMKAVPFQMQLWPMERKQNFGS